MSAITARIAYLDQDADRNIYSSGALVTQAVRPLSLEVVDLAQPTIEVG